MTADAFDELLDTCDSYLTCNGRLLGQLRAGANPATVAIALQAHLDILAAAVRHSQQRAPSRMSPDPGA